MSYQLKQGYGWLVICDLCKQFGAAFDRDWRPAHTDRAGSVLHLCHDCRPLAIWCAEHQRFHHPHDLHRHVCAQCGGLFTIAAKQLIDTCPSCRRRALPLASARA